MKYKYNGRLTSKFICC